MERKDNTGFTIYTGTDLAFALVVFISYFAAFSNGSLFDPFLITVIILLGIACITNGIYGYSRNPAFLGFDLVYLGLLMMYFNIVLLVFSIFSIVMLHLQILQEEKFLQEVFGKTYMDYKSKVMRYLGRK